MEISKIEHFKLIIVTTLILFCSFSNVSYNHQNNFWDAADIVTMKPNKKRQFTQMI